MVDQPGGVCGLGAVWCSFCLCWVLAFWVFFSKSGLWAGVVVGAVTLWVRSVRILMRPCAYLCAHGLAALHPDLHHGAPCCCRHGPPGLIPSVPPIRREHLRPQQQSHQPPTTYSRDPPNTPTSQPQPDPPPAGRTARRRRDRPLPTSRPTPHSTPHTPPHPWVTSLVWEGEGGRAPPHTYAHSRISMSSRTPMR